MKTLIDLTGHVNVGKLVSIVALIILFIIVFVGAIDVLFPKTEYTAQRVESIMIGSTDKEYVNFGTWIYDGKLNVKPGERVLVITKKSRYFNIIYKRDIHDNFKCK